MSTEPQKEQSDEKRTEDVEVKIVPEGTFGGTIEKPIIVKEGEQYPRIPVIKGAAKTERLIELTVDGNGVAKGEEPGGGIFF